LGPRLFAAFICGWNEVFSLQDYFFWVPVVGPIVGATIGVWLSKGFGWIVKHYGHVSIIAQSDAHQKSNSTAAPHIKEIDSIEF
jgi:hypothetical protein